MFGFRLRECLQHRGRMVPETGVEPVRPCGAADFKSATSTSFVTLGPVQIKKKGNLMFPSLLVWSGRRVSNSRPQPWQGCALPTELLPHFRVQRRMRIVRLFSDLSRASRKISASPPSSSGRRSVLMCLASGFGNASSTEDEWSQRRGSNPYALVGRRILSPLRLPVSSLWDLFRSKKRGT